MIWELNVLMGQIFCAFERLESYVLSLGLKRVATSQYDVIGSEEHDCLKGLGVTSTDVAGLTFNRFLLLVPVVGCI